MILHYPVPLTRQDSIDDSRLLVGLGFGIGSQNENLMRGDSVNDFARLPLAEPPALIIVRGKVLACLLFRPCNEALLDLAFAPILKFFSLDD